jgi:hypothetical protein
LGLSAGEDFDLETALKVHALHQQSWNGASDGIFTPALDAALGAWVFSEKPAEPAVVPSETDTPDHPPMV